jgi:hypothetical protein
MSRAGKTTATRKINLSPFTLECVEFKSPPAGFPEGYPCYKVLKINGITDIIELRKMETFFYMTDDPAVWKELGVDQKQ